MDIDLTWCEWVRHFMPYPLVTLIAALIQTAVLILLRLDTGSADESTSTTEDVRLAQARLMAIIVLTAYILMTGMFYMSMLSVLSVLSVLLLCVIHGDRPGCIFTLKHNTNPNMSVVNNHRTPKKTSKFIFK